MAFEDSSLSEVEDAGSGMGVFHSHGATSKMDGLHGKMMEKAMKMDGLNVYMGTSDNKMDELGVNYFRKLPYGHGWVRT